MHINLKAAVWVRCTNEQIRQERWPFLSPTIGANFERALSVTKFQTEHEAVFASLSATCERQAPIGASVEHRWPLLLCCGSRRTRPSRGLM